MFAPHAYSTPWKSRKFGPTGHLTGFGMLGP
jgi:hypothetical protein